MTRQTPRSTTRRRLYLTTAVTALLAWGGAAHALPTGFSAAGSIGGAATLVPGTNSLTVMQPGSRAVINWTTFNIDKDETVNFNQAAGKGAIAFNVVTGGGSSTIGGSLNATGGVWLFSPGGIIFGHGAVVNAGSFLASTGHFTSTSQQEALSGANQIDIGGQAAPDAGSITVDGAEGGCFTAAKINANAGFVVLNSPSITQAGTVTASDAVVYNADEGLSVQISPSTDGIILTNAFSPAGARSGSNIQHTGETDAGTWFEADAANDGAVPGSGIINLSGLVKVTGMKADTLNPGDPHNGYSVILDAESTTGSGAQDTTSLDGADGTIDAASSIYAKAGTVTTGEWSNTAGVIQIQAANAINVEGFGLTSAGAISLDPAGPVDVDAPISSATSVFIAAEAVNLGQDGSISAGPGGPADAGTITTTSATSSIILQDSATAGLTPLAHGPAVGDILIGAPLNWATGGEQLNLAAFHSLVVSAPIVASDDDAQVALNTGAGGDYTFIDGGSLSFTGDADDDEDLFINGTFYNLIFNQADLLAINDNGVGGLNGVYALAKPLDFAPTSTDGYSATATIFTAAPIASLANTPFSGTFEGLGNSISNLNIQAVILAGQYQFEPVAGQSVPSDYYGTNGEVGLFGSVSQGGMIRDVNLVDASVSGANGMQVGALVGHLDGTVLNSSASGEVLTGDATSSLFRFADADAGGLVGVSYGAIVNSASSASVKGGDAFAGGLVGADMDGSSIVGSSATGSVTVGATEDGVTPMAGGLVGKLDGFDLDGASQPASITGSYATGAVGGGDGSILGGFAGEVAGAQVTTSYATGLVSQTAAPASGLTDYAGGFAGLVTSGASIGQSYASGAVQTLAGSDPMVPTLAGGFAGDIEAGSTVTNSYALGAVAATGGPASDIGGFAGIVQTNASAAGVYATGHVTGSGVTGGLVAMVGDGDPDSGPPANVLPDTASISDGYWDVGATGQTGGYTRVGTGTSATNIIGVGAGTTHGAYDPDSYANFNLTNTWYMIAGETRPILRSEYSTTITDAHQLQLMALHPDADYVLANDIDAGETNSAAGVWNPANGFVPVGGNGPSNFTGTLNGGGHTVSNLFIDDTTVVAQTDGAGFPTSGFVGLFGVIGAGGVVDDINLTSEVITGADKMIVGGLAGANYGSVAYATSAGVVTTGNADVTTDPAQFASAGGLVGVTGLGGTVSNSSSSAIVTAGAGGVAGGLVGGLGSGGTITNSFASGAVGVSSGDAGGLVGSEYGYSSPDEVGSDPALIAGSHATGAVSGALASTVGGLTGTIQNSAVIGSYATGAVSGGAGSLAGGLAGAIEAGQVTTSYATGSVDPASGGATLLNAVGGFAGLITDGSTVTQSYASGAVSAAGGPDASHPTFAGGFVGDLDLSSSITDSYSLGAVTVTGSNFSDVGGFAGIVFNSVGAATNSTISGVYATGLVTGGGLKGGLAGVVGSGGVVENSYWDETTTGLAADAGSGTGTDNTGLGGMNGPSPYDQASYLTAGAEFDFTNTWFLIPGETRPILRSEYSTTITNAHQLQLIDLDPTADYTLANDVDASETTRASGVWDPANGFVPIGAVGDDTTWFTGNFDGQGHTLSNLTIIDTTPQPQSDPSNGATYGMVGLFSVVDGDDGTWVENLNITGAHVTGGDGMSVGVLAGYLTDNGGVRNVVTSGVVITGSGVQSGNTFVPAAAGGLVGASAGYITNSSSSASVTGSQADAGGLVGHLAEIEDSGGDIELSSASGLVTVGDNGGVQTPTAGGLVGSSDGGTTILDSFTTGNVDAGASSIAGGFIGTSQGDITNASATGVVTQAAGTQAHGGDLAGGFAGQIISGEIAQSFSTGAVNVVGSDTEATVGGFVGLMAGGEIDNAYATGAVTVTNSQTDVVGGFAGDIQSGEVNQVLATGLVTAQGETGGIAGLVQGEVNNAYWDSSTTNQPFDFGGEDEPELGEIGDVAGDPYDPSSYGGFDFGTFWSVPSSGDGGNFYPQLYNVSHVLKLTAEDVNIVYGNYPIYTVDVIGLQRGDTAAVLQNLTVTPQGVGIANSGYYNAAYNDPPDGVDVSAPYSLFPSATGANGATGPYRIIVSDDESEGFDPAGTLTITPATLTLTAVSDEKTYNGSAEDDNAYPTGPEVDGVVDGDYVNATQSFDGPDAGQHTMLVDPDYTVDDGNNGFNYVVTVVNGAPGDIDKAPLTVTLTGPIEKTYDSTTAADNITSDQYDVSGGYGDVSLVSTPADGDYDNADAGMGKTVTVTGLSLTGSGASNYSFDGTASGTGGVIDQAPLTVILSGPVQKTYNGNTSATLGSVNYTLDGTIYNEDDVALNDPTSGTYDTKDVGTEKAVTVNGLQLVGEAATNYTIDTTTITANVGEIDQASLVLTPVTDTRIYNGTTSSNMTPTYAPLFGGDTITGVTQSFASKNAMGVGGSTLNVSHTGFTVDDGVGGADYNVSFAPGVTGTITPAPLTITAATDSRTFDGGVDSDKLPTAGADELFGDDSIGCLSQAFVSKNVLGVGGSKLKVTGYMVNDGNDGDNYAVTLATASGTITPAPLIIDAASDSRQYDGDIDSSAAPTVPGGQLFGNDNVTGLAQAFQSRNVLGEDFSRLVVTAYTVNDGNSGDNYAVTLNTAAGTITPAPLTLNATTQTRQYTGDTLSSVLPTADTLLGGDTLTASQSFESKDVLGGGASILQIDSYTINDGNGGKNYTVTQVNTARGTITPAPLVLNATSETRQYDGGIDADTTPTADTLLGDDTLTATEAFGSKNVMGASGSTLSITSYTINDGNEGRDYTVTQTNTATGTITQAPLTITAGTDSRQYDGGIDSSGKPAVDTDDLFDDDSVTNVAQAFQSKNVLGTGGSTLLISGYTINDGNNGANYTVTLVNAAGTITPAPLVLSATPDAKTYDGGTASGAAPTANALVDGDTLSASQSFQSKNVLGAGASTLAVNPGYVIDDGNGGKNYTVTQINTAAGTIDPLALTVSLTGTVSKTYDGDTDATLAPGNYELSGVIQGDTVSLNDPVSGAYSSPSAGTHKLVTVDGLALAGTDAANYTIDDAVSGQVGTITAPPSILQITVPVDVVTSSEFEAATAAFQAITAAITGSTTVVNVFPAGPQDSSNPLGDNSPITGTGNRDLWTGPDENDCTPNTPCPVTTGTQP